VMTTTMVVVVVVVSLGLLEWLMQCTANQCHTS
jgi:hypothetical protein